LRNLVERRSLLFQLVRRDFEQRFVGSAVGWIWGVIQPLVLLASWSFVFSVCLKQKMPPNETVSRSASSLLEQASLITKTVFPAEMVPVSIFLSSLMSHLIALGLAVAAVGIWLNHIGPGLILLPLYMLLLGMFAVGFGWILSSLQVYLRDTAQVLTVILTFWFWLTPIFITEQQFPARLRFLLAANPLAYLVRAYRELLLSEQWPSLDEIGIVAVFAVAMFLAGGLFFRQMKRGFADVL